MISAPVRRVTAGLVGTTAVAGALLAGLAGGAQASQAHPSPDSSCSKPGSHAVYYTPVRHQRDLLTCTRITSGGHYRDLWKITGH